MKGLQDALTALGGDDPRWAESFDPNRHTPSLHCDDRRGRESTIVGGCFQQGFLCVEQGHHGFSMVKSGQLEARKPFVIQRGLDWSEGKSPRGGQRPGWVSPSRKESRAFANRPPA